jgi:hypothetical protein
MLLPSLSTQISIGIAAASNKCQDALGIDRIPEIELDRSRDSQCRILNSPVRAYERQIERELESVVPLNRHQRTLY